MSWGHHVALSPTAALIQLVHAMISGELASLQC